MKLITLLITLIITLAGSNVFAQTFLCENWSQEKYGKWEKVEGSLFVGEKNDDTITIKDKYGNKVTYTYLGKTLGGEYYTREDRGLTYIIEVGTIEVLVDQENFISMDFSIHTVNTLGAVTYCNWQ